MIEESQKENNLTNNKKLKSSGGVIANNYRQGSRAEIIAQYFFSEFCIAERVLKENDFGIDLYCTLMKSTGSIGLASTLFGVQIKSGNAFFNYQGDHLQNWLQSINIPLLICRINRDDLNIKIFSTWTLNSLVTDETKFTEIKFVESYSDIAHEKILKLPVVENNIATIWMCPPIIECKLDEIIKKASDSTTLNNEIINILKEWISLDFLNYAKRHVGITSYFGYINWETNKSLNISSRQWYRPKHFDNEQSIKAIHRILEDSVLIAFNKGKDYNFIKGIAELLKKNGIENIANLDSYHKKEIGIDSED